MGSDSGNSVVRRCWRIPLKTLGTAIKSAWLSLLLLIMIYDLCACYVTALFLFLPALLLLHCLIFLPILVLFAAARVVWGAWISSPSGQRPFDRCMIVTVHRMKAGDRCDWNRAVSRCERKAPLSCYKPSAKTMYPLHSRGFHVHKEENEEIRADERRSRHTAVQLREWQRS